MSASDAPHSPPTSVEGQSLSVHIRFAASQGRRLRRPTPSSYVEERVLWVERPVLMQRTDGTYHLIGTTLRPDALVRWVLSHGAAAEVTGPAPLRQRVAAEAWRIVQRHMTEELNEQTD